MVDLKLNLDYTVQVWKEGDVFVAHGMPIDVMSSGDTVPNACAALDEAITAFILTANDAGTLDDVLTESGYTLIDGEWICPDAVKIERHSLSIVA